MNTDDREPDNSAGGNSVGARLAQLRRGLGISGAELGRRMGVSQAKISRIETGASVLDLDAVQRIARLLEADDETVRELEQLVAEREQTDAKEERLGPPGLAGKQREIAVLEKAAEVIRVFQPTLVVGLLQTSEYARAVLTSSRDFLVKNALLAPSAVPQAVAARLRRQEILADSERRFHFLMTETALSNQICAPEDMPAQIKRIREVADQDNVSVGIIPSDLRWRFPPMHGFSLFDDVVEVDLMHTGLTTRGQQDVAMYRQVFDMFEQQAVPDIDPILDRYMEIYLDLSRPSRRRSAP